MKIINVDISERIGDIKPMNAVNNGPDGETTRGMTNLREYEELEIPYARNHDASFYSGYGGEHTVDVHRIFKKFDADENDPEAYVFGPTDECIKNTLKVGTKIFYRLGASIEHGYKYGTYPPKDFSKWARICEHIVRHYNEGWADGYRYGIEYWEIWNEPDCRNNDGSNPCWQGTDEEFIDLYETASKHLKKCFPYIKIGGPAFTSPKHGELQMKFLSAVKERAMPFDFYSFHRYMKKPDQVWDAAEMAQSSLEFFGIDKPELILNEWNYIRGWMCDEWRYSLRMEKSIKGASFIAGVMCAGQASDIDMLMYYDARPCSMCGIFDTDSLEPIKGYYAFKMFRELRRLGVCVRSDVKNGDVYSVAATNGTEHAVLITRYRDEDEAPAEEIRLRLNGICGNARAQVFLLDGESDGALVREERVFGGEITLEGKLFDTYLVKILPDEN